MQALPEGVADVLRPLLPTLSDETIAAVAGEVPAYRRPLEGAFGRGVRHGVEVALSRFVDLAEDPGRPVDARFRATYVELGRGEFRQGRSLDALLAAYRVGARIAWRRLTEAGEAAGMAPGDLYRVGEALFSYIDELSAESAEGWASAQAAAAGERQRRRGRLVALLAADPPSDGASLRAAADEAGWALPVNVAAFAVAGDEEVRLAPRIDPEVIAAAFEDAAVLVVPDPQAPGRRALVERVVGARPCAAGPAVALRDAGRTISRARQLLRLVRAGVVDGTGGPVDAADHLPTLVLHADASLAHELAARELAPLDTLPPTAGAKLAETLRVWLDHRGRVEETAYHLDVHPQTVRYRVNQLRDLFGARLEDPEGRHALAMALRARAPRAV